MVKRLHNFAVIFGAPQLILILFVNLFILLMLVYGLSDITHLSGLCCSMRVCFLDIFMQCHLCQLRGSSFSRQYSSHLLLRLLYFVWKIAQLVACELAMGERFWCLQPVWDYWETAWELNTPPWRMRFVLWQCRVGRTTQNVGMPTGLVPQAYIW